MGNKDILIISTADWDNPIQTNKQHISKELANLGHRILYVESLGIRKIKIGKRDFKRIIKRIINMTLVVKRKDKNIWVISPILFPGATSKLILFINKIILNSNIQVARKILNFKNDCLWTYNPMTSLFIDTRRFKTSLYHAVDSIEHQPFMPKQLIREEEKKLAYSVDVIFVTSQSIFKKLEKYNKKIQFFGNVCDFDHFSKAPNLSFEEIPNDIKKIKKPLVGFIGSISEYKLDFKLIRVIAKKLKYVNFVFIGPTEDSLDKNELNNLQEIENIYLLGYRKYNSLPNYCAYFDIAWLPIVHNKYTDSMFPMKFFEYLASGLPVISTSISSLKDYKDYVYLSNNYEEIAKQITLSLNSKKHNIKKRQDLAKLNTYKRRTKLMLKNLNL
ncbi:MAG: glycosyl transferase [Flavobacteriaceae bacterium]|nr:glycosyl transferase [Flavobacteriaceae bacterium]